jgi:hypothetical protein
VTINLLCYSGSVSLPSLHSRLHLIDASLTLGPMGGLRSDWVGKEKIGEITPKRRPGDDRVMRFSLLVRLVSSPFGSGVPSNAHSLYHPCPTLACGRVGWAAGCSQSISEICEKPYSDKDAPQFRPLATCFFIQSHSICRELGGM